MAAHSTQKPSQIPIHVTRNGEIYVTAKDVVESEKFREQLRKMAEIPVNRRRSL